MTTRRTKYASVTFDSSALERQIAGIGSAVNEAVRPAAQAGAQLLYDDVKRNVAGLGTVSGRLQKAIYQTYSKDNSSERVATYHIAWRRTGQIIEENGKQTKLDNAAPHAHLIEFGHWMPYRVSYNPKTGKFYTMIRPEMRGKPKPSKKNKAAMDAYFMPWPDNKPRWVMPKPFLRPAMGKFPEALKAAEERFYKEFKERVS